MISKLQTPYEVAAKSVIPAIRGMISKKLMERNFTQAEIATTLGITQPAVSKYIAEKRGHAIDFDEKPDVKEMIDRIADAIQQRKLNRLQVAITIKEVCDYIMQSGYMCGFHYDVEPEAKAMNCTMCMEPAGILQISKTQKRNR
jgi:predicted transcriptional regulator